MGSWQRQRAVILLAVVVQVPVQVGRDRFMQYACAVAARNGDVVLKAVLAYVVEQLLQIGYPAYCRAALKAADRIVRHLTLAQVFDALSYYADYQDEINHYIEHNRVPDHMVHPLVRQVLQKP